MNQASVHLLLNHVPIIGTVIGMLVMIAGFIFKNVYVKRTALGIFILASLAAIPVFLTGEGAEDAVEKLPGVSKSIAENHEDLALIFIWILGGIGVLSIISFATDLMNLQFGKYLYIIILIISVGAVGMAKQVGTTGGEIRHTEIRSGAVAPAQDAGEKDED
jgi:hypothetical protein